MRLSFPLPATRPRARLVRARLAGALIAGAAASAGAQAPAARPDSGAVVRLHAPGLDLSGRTVTLDAPWGDPLVVLDPRGEGRTAVPLARVRRVDVRVHEGRGGAQRGAVTGLIVGAAPSLVLVAIAVQADRNCHGECFLPATPFAVGVGLLFTGLTTGIGALVGHVRSADRWATAWPPQSAALRAGPLVTGQGVGLALRGQF